jgi:hypothetical protein
MPTMKEIENRALAFSESRTKLAEYVAELQAGIEALKRDHLPRVRRALHRAAQLQAELIDQVGESKDLFVKPRTVILHGIRLGLEKGKGAIDFEDAEKVCELIEKKLPDLADTLIKTDKKPIKTALKNLSVKELKAIGCTVEETGDQVVVRAVDRDVDKLVTALLKGAAEEQAESS